MRLISLLKHNLNRSFCSYVTYVTLLRSSQFIITFSNVLITNLQLFVCICCNFSKSSKHDVKFFAKEHHSDKSFVGGGSTKSNLGKKKKKYFRIDSKTVFT